MDTKGKVRVFVWADAVVHTGFSRVMHSIIENLPPEYDIYWLGVNYHGDPHGYPLKIYPASSMVPGDLYGFARLDELLELVKPDLIFLLNDAWILDKQLKQIKKFYTKKTLPKIVTYIPVDARNHDPEWYKEFDVVDRLVAYTEFGKEVILKAYPNEKTEVIFHGVDSKIFFKADDKKEDIKKAVYGKERPEYWDNSFIVFNGNRNQPRKKLDLTIKGFGLFAEGKPNNVKIYMHCGNVDKSINVKKYVNRLGLDGRLIMTNDKHGPQQISDKVLNLLYNATDVGINTGVGEGWGLPNMEHASTGAVQVVADHSSLHELYSDCGILIPTYEDFIIDDFMTTGKLCRVEDIAESLNHVYNNPDLYKSLSEKSVEKFSNEIYSWAYISTQWDKLFKEIL